MAGNAIPGREPLSNRFTPRLYTMSGARAGGLAWGRAPGKDVLPARPRIGCHGRMYPG